MKNKNRDQIIELLRRVDRSLDHCNSIKEACERVGVSRSSFYRWQKKISGEQEEYKFRDKRREKMMQQLEDQVVALRFAASGKLTCPLQRRYIVNNLQENQGWSQRRACRAIKQNRSTQRYTRKQNPTAAELEVLANQYPILGSQKLGELGEKKTGIKSQTLAQKYHRERRGRTPSNKVMFSRIQEETSNQITEGNWACDLTTSKLCNGKKIVWFAVVNELTRECHWLEARTTWTGKSVAKRIRQMVTQSDSPPQTIRVDNAKLWQSIQLQVQMRELEIEIRQTAKASPWENAKIESFFASFHREFIKRFALLNTYQANKAAGLFVELYNHQRPHSALGGVPPAKFRTSTTRRE